LTENCNFQPSPTIQTYDSQRSCIHIYPVHDSEIIAQQFTFSESIKTAINMRWHQIALYL